MDKFFFTAYSATKSRTLQGDFIDQLHSSYTVTSFLAVLLIIVSQQYSGNAIACWLPKQFTGDQESYIHQFCWINSTYYYPNEKDADQFGSQPKYVIQYYQFILFILSGQIMLFYLPSLLWKSLVSDSGSYINKLLDSVDRAKIFTSECEKAEEPELPKFPLESVNEEEPNQTLNDSILSGISHRSYEKKPLLSNQSAEQFRNDFVTLKTSLHRSSSLKKTSFGEGHRVDMASVDNKAVVDISPQRKISKKFSKFNLKKRLNKVIIKPIRGVKNLAMFYFAMKFFNLGNVIFQLVGLRFIFGNEFWRYGFDYMSKVMNNEDPLWMSKQFPIVTICDYYVHQNLRRVHWNSSQCLLAINVLIEKFYVFIWLWLYILLVLTFLNIISWFLEIYSSTRTGFILKYLRIKERMNENYQPRYLKSSSIKKNVFFAENEAVLNTTQSTSSVTKENVELFHKEYLGYDGLVMMHIVKAVAGDMIFIELLQGLWIEYLRKKAD